MYWGSHMKPKFEIALRKISKHKLTVQLDCLQVHGPCTAEHTMTGMFWTCRPNICWSLPTVRRLSSVANMTMSASPVGKCSRRPSTVMAQLPVIWTSSLECGRVGNLIDLCYLSIVSTLLKVGSRGLPSRRYTAFSLSYALAAADRRLVGTSYFQSPHVDELCR